MSNGLVKTSAGPQKKGRTITFRVDESVAEKLEKYARMRNYYYFFLKAQI